MTGRLPNAPTRPRHLLSAYGAREWLFELTKAAVFRTPGLSALAAQYRGWITDVSYRRLASHYAALASPQMDLPALLRRRASERRPSTVRTSRPGILYVGTDYEQDTSGILQALARFGTVVPFTKEDGSYGQVLGNLRFSLTLRDSNSKRLLDIVKSRANTAEAIGFVIGQMWDGYIDPAVLDTARREYGCIVVNIAMDDRHTFSGVHKHGVPIGTRGLVLSLDLVATTAPECVDWYLKEGCPAIFLPEASNPETFHSMPELGKAIDVCFVGARYGIRQGLVEALQKAGIRVQAYGSGWPNGRIANADIPRLFAQSKIVLGVGTVGHSRRLFHLKMRDFDGPMSGSCYVTNDNPDLRRLYHLGEEIAVYSDAEDCVRVVRHLLANDSEREEIARRGAARARAEHTWDRRFQYLWATIFAA